MDKPKHRHNINTDVPKYLGEWGMYKFFQRRRINEEIIGKENIQYNELGYSYSANYFAGDVKSYWEDLFKKLKPYGVTTMDEIKNIIYPNTNLFNIDVDDFFDGHKQMTVHQHLNLVRALGFDLQGRMRRMPFNSEVIKDRLILERRISPKFSLNIKIDDWWDMDINIQDDMRNISLQRFVEMAYTLTGWYFNGETYRNVEENKQAILNEIAEYVQESSDFESEEFTSKIEELRRHNKLSLNRRVSKNNPYTQTKLRNFIRARYWNGELPISAHYRELLKLKPKSD